MNSVIVFQHPYSHAPAKRVLCERHADTASAFEGFEVISEVNFDCDWCQAANGGRRNLAGERLRERVAREVMAARQLELQPSTGRRLEVVGLVP